MSVSINGTTGVTFTDASVQNTAATGFGFKNRIINGAMVIDQRNAGASVTQTTSDLFPVDRWNITGSVASKFTAQQTPSATETGYATRVAAGFTNYLGATSSSAYSILASDYFYLSQVIEGFNTADLVWGTSGAKTVTLSFWVYSSLTGTFGGSVRNGAGTRSYPFTYTISSASTWEQKTITIAGDTTGTWIGATNGKGVCVFLGLGVGSTYSGTANSWQAGNYVSVTGATSVVGTNNATFYITGVQLEKGSTATSFDYRPYGTELALCQRYYEFGGYFTQAANSPGGVIGSVTGYRATKRATPTVSGTATVGTSTNFNPYTMDYLQQIQVYAVPNVNGQMYGSWTSSSEL